MIKRFICWIWGHKITTEVKYGKPHITPMYYETKTETVMAPFCRRCGHAFVTIKTPCQPTTSTPGTESI